MRKVIGIGETILDIVFKNHRNVVIDIPQQMLGFTDTHNKKYI